MNRMDGRRRKTGVCRGEVFAILKQFWSMDIDTPERRLNALITVAERAKLRLPWRTKKDLFKTRIAFNVMKREAGRTIESNCWICLSKKALVRHHVIPLAFRKSPVLDARNLVTLCENCHAAVHPHLRKQQSRSSNTDRVEWSTTQPAGSDTSGSPAKTQTSTGI